MDCPFSDHAQAACSDSFAGVHRLVAEVAERSVDRIDFGCACRHRDPPPGMIKDIAGIVEIADERDAQIADLRMVPSLKA
ncbi:MAG: hypothetical protein ACJAWY_000607 [Sphingomonas echinoides]